ncbi:hypothetical protein B0H10DRAFT_1909635 [Mycena sp. CBHHK59/15]|nr:hypothetical protein B0H10DRAFT_1909635 [Mycena sp. CBHHK59/15]
MGPNHKCQECGDPATKHCSGCKIATAWYCSNKCQRSHWVVHIFECNPKRAINLSDYLALAVRENLFPDNVHTCEAFGFTREFSVENRSKLLGLYIGLIEHLEISHKKVYQWQKDGTLVENIKVAFSVLPEGSRSGYYPWFLKNQWVLDRTLPQPGDPVDEMMMRSWQYVHGPNARTDKHEDIAAEMSKWPDVRQECLLLCNLILSQLHPSPELEIWVNFGFCACQSEGSERELARVYTDLIMHRKCTFEELYIVYDSSKLIVLFDSRGLRAQREKIPHLADVLGGSPRSFKSVWFLKQRVTRDEEAQGPMSVVVDYGFMNCLRNEEETWRLKELYRQVFALPSSDLTKLHEACIQGRLYNYMGGLLKLKKKDQKLMKRLLKNPYPLLDL